MKPEFGTGELENMLLRQSQLIHTRMAGRAVIRVVHRCNEAIEDNNLIYRAPTQCTAGTPPFATCLRVSYLASSHEKMAREAALVCARCLEANENGGELDLSGCQLMQVPDAVYHLLRNTTLTSCNLASNVISKIPPKFPSKFSLITELNIASNKLTKLPEELADCTKLAKLDISHNNFADIPPVVFRLPEVKVLLANNNFILDVDVKLLPKDSPIEEVDLRENPLIPSCHDMLSSVTTVSIRLSPREKEDWEDLEI